MKGPPLAECGGGRDGADEQRQQADHGEPEIADELEGDHGEQNGERCRDQRESVLGSQNLKDLAEHAALARISPSDLTPDARVLVGVRTCTAPPGAPREVVPHHALHERDRGSRLRPIGIIDEAVDFLTIRARSNIEYGLIEELQICPSLVVGIHQIVLRDRCADINGRHVSDHARLN